MAKRKKAKALIICNGELPRKTRLVALAQEVDTIACADGGANWAKKYGIVPDFIIGDLDSIDKKVKKYFRNAKIVHDSSQDQTDLEKALDVLLATGVEEITVAGATGKRTDHTVTNFSILKKYHRRCALRYVDRHCEISLVGRKATFFGRKGGVISLAPLGKVEGITTKGLKYRLTNETLEVGVREGQSNVIISNPVELTVKRGALLLFEIYASQPELNVRSRSPRR